MFGFKSATYEFVEGRGYQGLDIDLLCGNLGESTMSLYIATDDANGTATATGS